MGIPSELRDAWTNRNRSLLIASPIEDEKILRSRQCTQEGVRAGAKAAAIASVASAVPTVCNFPSFYLLLCLVSGFCCKIRVNLKQVTIFYLKLRKKVMYLNIF
ncbi:early nodulin-93-like [Olea europaea subsp. europaea]|uniref:Early nodulin-93-like n=1 Tax=Olea europaea subsp. europaea TaxID=158383 RepID=A0A8S0V4L5_OLEEU|nr:early nodulin-93-like [Olea europaea subsp. europaea]